MLSHPIKSAPFSGVFLLTHPYGEILVFGEAKKKKKVCFGGPFRSMMTSLITYCQ